MKTQNLITFPVSLILAHQKAQEFSKHQARREKARQVYLNTLAVHAVNSYLNIFGIETDLEASDSWDVVKQTLSDLADLNIKSKGKIECRFILPEQKLCYVPMDVWEDRIGYVFVKFNQELTNGELLGFVPKVVKEEFPLTELRPLEEFPEYLDKLIDKRTPIVVLTNWLNNRIDEGWKSIDEILNRENNQLAFQFRGGEKQPENKPKRVYKAKEIELSDKSQNFALLVDIDSEKNDSEFQLSTELYPLNNEPYLPSGLQMIILDESDKSIMQAETKTNESLIFDFSGERGDRFTVKVVLGDVSITEKFII